MIMVDKRERHYKFELVVYMDAHVPYSTCLMWAELSHCH